jgi:hypothetical protein
MSQGALSGLRRVQQAPRAGLSGEIVAGMGGESSRPASIDNLLERLDR